METVKEFGKYEIGNSIIYINEIDSTLKTHSLCWLILTIHDIQFQETSMVQAQPENAVHISFNRSSYRVEYKFQRRVPKDLENSCKWGMDDIKDLQRFTWNFNSQSELLNNQEFKF